MSSARPPDSTVTIVDDDLRAELERALAEYRGEWCRVVSISRRPSAYRTSFALEEVAIALDDGTELEVILKDVSDNGLSEGARGAKPLFLMNSNREIETYRHILASNDLTTATCYGASVDPAAGRYWLFLERVPGVELYQIGDCAVWAEAARWLAAFHGRFADESARSLALSRVPLLVYDLGFYRRWPRRALEHAQRQPAATREMVEWLVDRYEPVAKRLATLSRTVIHGEFYASNVRVNQMARGIRICPVDWEMAAVGSGLIDLAALVSGSWSDADRMQLAEAYYEVDRSRSATCRSFDEMLDDLRYCRLHVSIQWLGWAAEWTPPSEHAHDWLGDALVLAGELRL